MFTKFSSSISKATRSPVEKTFPETKLNKPASAVFARILWSAQKHLALTAQWEESKHLHLTTGLIPCGCSTVWKFIFHHQFLMKRQASLGGDFLSSSFFPSLEVIHAGWARARASRLAYRNVKKMSSFKEQERSALILSSMALFKRARRRERHGTTQGDKVKWGEEILKKFVLEKPLPLPRNEKAICSEWSIS